MTDRTPQHGDGCPRSASRRRLRRWVVLVLALALVGLPPAATAVAPPHVRQSLQDWAWDPGNGRWGPWQWDPAAGVWRLAGADAPGGTQAQGRSTVATALEGLVVGADGRHLASPDGRPVTWIADTAWALPESLSRQEATSYFATRARQGFTVVMFAAVFSEGGRPNRDGAAPFEGDLSRPNDAYYAHVTWLVEEARRHGLAVAMLPAWSKNHAGRQLTAENARAYGAYLAGRVAPAMWVLGGDDGEPHAAVWTALSEGLRSGGQAGVPMTYHPVGAASGQGNYPGGDVTMVQTSHCVTQGFTDLVATSLAGSGRPTLDAEPLYAGHPWCWEGGRRLVQGSGFARDDQVRKHLLWSWFQGGFGLTYGHHSVWQFAAGPGQGVNDPPASWQDALAEPVAEQIRHLRALLESRPNDRRVADDAAITAGLGEGWERAVATRDADGRWLMVYVPEPREVTVTTAALTGATQVRVTWFDPATGERVDGGTVPAGSVALRPPAGPSSSADRVAVLDPVAAPG